MIQVHPDAFSNGQIESKLWLCQELARSWEWITTRRKFSYEPYLRSGCDHPVIWVLGGWHGVLPFLMLAREVMPVETIRSLDIDPSCQPVADALLENWVFQGWKAKAATADANLLDYAHVTAYGPIPDIVINTSAEHFVSKAWFDNIPAETYVVIQTNDMPHADHVFQHESVDDLLREFPLHEVYFSGTKAFTYPDWRFNRFMVIGRK